MVGVLCVVGHIDIAHALYEGEVKNWVRGFRCMR